MVTTASLKDFLLDSAREVFETMVFVALAESDGNSPPIEDVALLGSITFKGRLEGCLAICCDVACARTIAANMLGMDTSAELGEADICDAIGELANMVMGAIKSKIQDDVGAIEVSIPSVVRGRELKNRLGEGANSVTVVADIEGQHSAEFSLLYRNGPSQKPTQGT
ncbi:MAG: chemotaxis protein CheX [Sedimentisphaerales bacterium]|nr:chemotaxis protein CheX [Sedimentisphaerales bacterium]